MDASNYERQLTPLLVRSATYARSILGNRADAEDAVQQAALRGWERIDHYDSARPFKAWWFTILRNCCMDILRKRRTTHHENIDAIADPVVCNDNTADWEQLDAGLRQLAAHHQEILRLKYFGELSYDELAVTLDIPKGTVMSRLHLARKALAAQIHEEKS